MGSVSNITKRILAAHNITVKDARAGSLLGEVVRKAGVQHTSEVDRIARLPRRNWQDLLADDYVGHLSKHCLRPGGSGRLFDAQAAVLTEFVDYGGFLGNIGLGEGKSLITFLAPTLLGAERPVLVAPGKLRDKTIREIKAYRKDWLVHPRIEFISYEQISRNPEILMEADPDCFLGDEVHKLKNLRAACTIRVGRLKKSKPYMPFMGLSGTLSSRALREIWHLMMWALLPARMPLPRNPKECDNWGQAVDEKVDDRLPPGALIDVFASDIHPTEEELCNEDPEVVRARMGIRRRMQETAGYISTTRMSCNASISIEIVRPEPSPIIDAHIKTLREQLKDEHGLDVVTSEKTRAADVWAKARQYSVGFVYRWEPEPTLLWREARRNKDRLVRESIANFTALDTPMQVINAIRAGKITKPFDVSDDPAKPKLLSPLEILERWKVQESQYTYQVIPDWVDLSRVNFVADRVIGSGEEVIVWVEHVAFGEKLAEITKVPFYHEGGFARNTGKKLFIDDARGPIIASVNSNFEGRNLQHYSKNFIVSAPPSGLMWEQLFGRTHRTHQQADELEFYVFEACLEHREGFAQVLRDCANTYQTYGTPQRLLRADILNP